MEKIIIPPFDSLTFAEISEPKNIDVVSQGIINIVLWKSESIR